MLELRKVVVQVEDTFREAGREVSPPSRRAGAAAVIANPYAGRYVEDLEPLYDVGRDVAAVLVERALAALGAPGDEVTAYGKGAVVGTDGELEHAAAILHPRFGAPVRAAIGGGQAIIASTKRVGAPGSTIVFPLGHRHDIWSFDDMDGMEMAVPDAPRPGEILVCLGLAVGGRPLKRVRKDA